MLIGTPLWTPSNYPRILLRRNRWVIYPSNRETHSTLLLASTNTNTKKNHTNIVNKNVFYKWANLPLVDKKVSPTDKGKDSAVQCNYGPIQIANRNYNYFIFWTEYCGYVVFLMQFVVWYLTIWIWCDFLYVIFLCCFLPCGFGSLNMRF